MPSWRNQPRRHGASLACSKRSSYQSRLIYSFSSHGQVLHVFRFGIILFDTLLHQIYILRENGTKGLSILYTKGIRICAGVAVRYQVRHSHDRRFSGAGWVVSGRNDHRNVMGLSLHNRTACTSIQDAIWMDCQNLSCTRPSAAAFS